MADKTLEKPTTYIRHARNTSHPYNRSSNIQLATPPETPPRQKQRPCASVKREEVKKVKEGKEEQLDLPLQRADATPGMEEVKKVKEEKDEQLDLPLQRAEFIPIMNELERQKIKLDEITEFLQEQVGILRCGLCEKVFRDPYALDCGHVFCAKCLNNYKHSKIRAPDYASEPLVCPDKKCQSKILFGPWVSRSLGAVADLLGKELPVLRGPETYYDLIWVGKTEILWKLDFLKFKRTLYFRRRALQKIRDYDASLL
ncbi:hypothetical protein E1B28_002266 [Marasmius oreades]|uniref:RING-type domain-containing protein n=1 Tax=Marasmius oreades TaxID=181124 RepID=A0A9P7RN01_9AGAR|nr:uncharacterized protein E1B28_002266 [Marasmius oreades]KAG7086302.1 hypothetical protein E1B28_002266 [Marasmius oreades]